MNFNEQAPLVPNHLLKFYYIEVNLKLNYIINEEKEKKL